MTTDTPAYSRHFGADDARAIRDAVKKDLGPEAFKARPRRALWFIPMTAIIIASIAAILMLDLPWWGNLLLSVLAGHTLACFQSNSEAELIERIHAARDEEVACALFNPAAFTHTSVALRDALLAAELAFIEVHLSNTAKREPFRHHSYFADIAVGTITGFGARGYAMALDAAMAGFAETAREH